MALKKRKTPLHVLFGEREALKNHSIVKPKEKQKNDTIIQNKNQR
ncbi:MULTISPECIES: hypothetical protein [unclassified Chryseobacterium]|nr:MULTISPECIES: hypothetical protein [unclassified Chryseobacterium]